MYLSSLEVIYIYMSRTGSKLKHNSWEQAIKFYGGLALRTAATGLDGSVSVIWSAPVNFLPSEKKQMDC